MSKMKNEEEISDFSSEWNNSDQILVIGDRNLHVHRCILSIWSPVFNRMFNGNFKETKSTHIELKGKTYSEVEEMLKVMYNRTRDITEENVYYLLELSEEYQIYQLRKECIKYIMNSDKSGIKAISYLRAVDRFNIEEVVEECTKELASIQQTELEAATEYTYLSDKLKNNILTLRVKVLEEEAIESTNLFSSVSHFLYQQAKEGHINFLREQGLEESVFSRCINQANHVNTIPGQNFDIECSTCRKNVMLTKKFEVETREMSKIMERMYARTKNKPQLQPKNIIGPKKELKSK